MNIIQIFIPWLKLKEKISIKNLPIDKDGFFTIAMI